MDNSNSQNNIANAFYFFAFIALVVFSLSSLAKLLSSIAISVLIWFLINAFSSKIKSIPLFKNLPDFIAIIIAVLVIFITLYEVSGFIAKSMSDISSSLAGLDTKVKDLIEKFSILTGINLSEQGNKIIQSLSLSSLINKLLSLFSSIVSNSLQILLFVLFLLFDQNFLPLKLKALFPAKKDQHVANQIIKSISNNVRTYIYITTIISMSTGFLTFLVCYFFKVDGAVLWGFLAFVLNFIPTIGSIIAVTIPSIFALITLDPSIAIFIIPVLGAIQFSLGNILQPRLMGDILNISNFIVIFSLVTWGMMWGTVGMFLSIPLMVILSIILSQFQSTRFLAIIISKDGKILPMQAEQK